jgi:tetratricopeptide (TPR) repeat protein
VLLWQEQGRTREALADAQASERRALAGEAEARRQRGRAQTNFQRALVGAARILMELDEKPGAPPLQGDRLREALVGQGLQFFQSFIDDKSPDPAVRFESAQAYDQMGRVYCSQYKGEQGQAMLRKEFAILQGLVDEYPQEKRYWRHLIQTRYVMGLMYTSLKQPRAAHAEYVRTAELYRLALPHDGDGATLNNYASFLSDCPDVAARDPARAVTLAEQAVAREPGVGAYWNTLGVARYRTGQWSAAEAALKRSVELRKGGDPWDWFFLAMTAWRQGDREQARGWYDRSVRWMDAHPPPNEELLRYRKEADALFGK